MDGSQEALESDGLCRAFLLTKTAAYATHLAFLHCQRALVAVGAVDVDQLLAGVHLAHPGDVARTGLETLAAACALVDIHRGILFALRISHGTERTGHNTVAQAKTTKIAGRLPLIVRMFESTRTYTVEMIHQVACFACGITADYSDLPDANTFGQADDLGNLSHLFVADARTIEAIESCGSAACTREG